MIFPLILENREKSLFRQYLFTCGCNICIADRELGRNHEASDLGDAGDKLIEYIEKYTKADDSEEYDLESILDAVRFSLANANSKGRVLFLCEALDKIARTYAKLREFRRAATIVMEAIGQLISSKIFDANDVAVARERVKASGLYAQFDLLEARRLAIQALETLSITCSANDIDLLEAKRIATYSQSMT